MTFDVCNLGSKQLYFNRAYVLRVPIFSFTTVGMFAVLFSGSVWNSDYLVRHVINASPGYQEAKSLTGKAQGFKLYGTKYFQTRAIVAIFLFFPKIDCAFAPFAPPLRCHLCLNMGCPLFFLQEGVQTNEQILMISFKNQTWFSWPIIRTKSRSCLF